jgi:Protein of unknown function (DUF2933)
MNLNVVAHEGEHNAAANSAHPKQQKGNCIMALQRQHEHESPHPSNLRDWLYSRTGIATCVAVAVLGFLIYTGHSAHLLGLVPYLLILACPLMHIFMHGGHHNHHGKKSEREDN